MRPLALRISPVATRNSREEELCKECFQKYFWHFKRFVCLRRPYKCVRCLRVRSFSRCKQMYFTTAFAFGSVTPPLMAFSIRNEHYARHMIDFEKIAVRDFWVPSKQWFIERKICDCACASICLVHYSTRIRKGEQTFVTKIRIRDAWNGALLPHHCQFYCSAPSIWEFLSELSPHEQDVTDDTAMLLAVCETIFHI